MDARTAITQAGLAMLPNDTPITLVGSADGYAVAVGTADRPRWLHTTSGQFRLFLTADRALSLLKACGIRRIIIDLSGGTPT